MPYVSEVELEPHAGLPQYRLFADGKLLGYVPTDTRFPTQYIVDRSLISDADKQAIDEKIEETLGAKNAGDVRSPEMPEDDGEEDDE